MDILKNTILVSLVSIGAPLSMMAETLYLHTPDTPWRVAPLEEINFNQAQHPGFDASAWVPARVPGTAFAAYCDAGLEKDPSFGDNIHQVPREKYDRTMAYRTELEIPATMTGQKLWLNFNGINRKGTIWLNGTQLGQLDGFMDRGRFDITNIANRNGKNVVMVTVEIPETPLANEGSPNYLCSGGWDWMPYVPGLNSGITDKVWISDSGEGLLVDPYVRTADLPTLARADMEVETGVKNTSNEKKKMTIKGVITPGDIQFEKTVEVNPGRTATVKFDKRYYPQLTIDNPKLWWPNGYGEPNLYNCHFTVVTDGEVSQEQDVTFGIRKYSYDKKDGILHLAINGVPVFVKGGNWGIAEYMLRIDPKEYDTRLRLHKEMNFNMARNWLGAVTDDEFYQACDKYGIMVWDDFWINSNAVLPYDLNAFNHNMVEKIKRVRNHPSIAVWCGDNEAYPEQPLMGWMDVNVSTFDNGDRLFQPCSNDGGLSGSGYWGAFDPRYYFIPYPENTEGGNGTPGWGFRTEIGTAVVPAYKSFVKFMPEENHWPIDEMWNIHYFGPNAFNGLPDQYQELIATGWGQPKSAEEFCKKAQLVNIESNKAMYEGWLDHMWDDASGIMTWMSQPAYPCMVWQTYDYYYDPTGAYWGCKSACEPLHIYWNPVNNGVRIANTTANNYQDLTAEVKVYNLDGQEIKAYTKSATVSSPSNSVNQAFVIDFNTERPVLSLGKDGMASSITHGKPADAFDGDATTRWAANKGANEWLAVDLGKTEKIGGIRLNWEDSYGKKYKIQVSQNGKDWTELLKENDGKRGWMHYSFPEVEARYVRMLGIERGWWFGYSLYNFDVLGAENKSDGLDDTHFVRLTLRDAQGNVVSENNYLRGHDRHNFLALNSLPKADVKVKHSIAQKGDRSIITAEYTNPKNAKAPAYAVHAQPLRQSDGERILPAIMSDNYFTLMPGETKTVTYEFDSALLPDGKYTMEVNPYNN